MNKIERFLNSAKQGVNGAKRAYRIHRAAGVGVVSAVGLAASYGLAHAQVTFSATAPQAALTNSIDGSLDFFWDNATGVLVTVAAIGIVLTLAMMVIRKLGGKKRAR